MKDDVWIMTWDGDKKHVAFLHAYCLTYTLIDVFVQHMLSLRVIVIGCDISIV